MFIKYGLSRAESNSWSPVNDWPNFLTLPAELKCRWSNNVYRKPSEFVWEACTWTKQEF